MRGRATRGRVLWTALIVAALAGAVVVTAGWTSKRNASQKYVIGWAEAKTGYLSFVDKPVEEGIRVAMDQVNRAGGIAGKWKIELITEDQKTNPAVGATVVQDLIGKHANFIVTTCDVDQSLPGAQIAARNHLPVMSSCGADSSFPQRVPKYGFLNVPGTLSQGAALAEWAFPKGYRRTYVHLSKDEGYTHTLAEAFADRFTQLGGKVIGESRYHIGDTDYRAVATKIVAAKPDLIMTNTFPPDSIAFLKALDRAGNKTPILLVDGNDTPVIFQAGKQLKLSTMTTYGGYRGPGTRIAQMNADYKKMFGHDPESLQGVALGGDLIYTVKAAVEKARSTDGDKVAAAMNTLKNIPGVTGPITFTNGIPRKLYAVVRFDLAHKKFVVIKNFFPKRVPLSRK